MENKLIDFAKKEDLLVLYNIINESYRENLGWTNESLLVEGNRIDLQTLNNLLKNKNCYFFLLRNNSEIFGCILINNTDKCEIGTFAIKPQYQNKGYGKLLLSHAENFIISTLNRNKAYMYVLDKRQELINFYIRRKYIVDKNFISNYPKNKDIGIPKKHINVIRLFKNLY